MDISKKDLSLSLIDKDKFFFINESNILLYMELKETGFSTDRIRTCYHVGIIFMNENYTAPTAFNHIEADEILQTLFKDDYKKLWEHGPTSNKGLTAAMHNFYLFVSRPYGMKATTQDEADKYELLKNKYFKYFNE